MGSVPQNRSATNGFHWKSAHQSGGGERGSSRKRSPPEIRAPKRRRRARFVPQKKPAGNPRAKAAAESAVRPAKEARRKSARQSGGGERGSSRKRSPPEIRAPSQPESAPRQRFAGNPHAKAAAEGVPLRRIAGERPSEQRIQRFEAGQARFVQRKGFDGGRSAPSQPELVLRQRFAGKPRAGQTILRSVESSGVRPSSGFSVSKPVRRGSSSGRASPGKNVPSQLELVLRQRFRREATRWALGRPALRGRRFYAP